MARRTRQRPSPRRPPVRGRLWLESVVSMPLRLCALKCSPWRTRVQGSATDNALQPVTSPRLCSWHTRCGPTHSGPLPLASCRIRPWSKAPLAAAGLRQDGPPTANGGIGTPPPAAAARTMSNISFPDGEERLETLATAACHEFSLHAAASFAISACLGDALASVEGSSWTPLRGQPLVAMAGVHHLKCCSICFTGVRGAPLPTDLVFGSMPPNVVVRRPAQSSARPSRADHQSVMNHAVLSAASTSCQSHTLPLTRCRRAF